MSLRSAAIRHIRDVTTGVDLPDGQPCEALFASEDCTISGVDATGVTFTGLTLIKGWNPVGVKRVDSLSGGTLKAGYV